MNDLPAERPALQRAKELWELGFRHPAIDVLRTALAARPEDGALRRLRAILLAREGRTEEAFDEIQQALLLAPVGYEGLLVLAAGYAHRGRRRLAAGVARELAADDRFPSDLWESLYGLLSALGDWDAAVAVCERALRDRPDDDRLYFVAALALRQAKRPPERVAAMLEKAVQLNPREGRYRVSLGVHWLNLGRTDEARRQLGPLAADDFDRIACPRCVESALQASIRLGEAECAAHAARRLARLAAAQAAAG